MAQNALEPTMTTAIDLATTILLGGRSCLAALPEWEGELAEKKAALTGRLVPRSTAEPFVWSSEVCRSASELLQTLQWSGGLSGGVGPLPLLKASRQFFESLRTTLFSVSLVVQARRVVAALACDDVRCKPDLAIPTNSASLDTFVALHGDSWVNSVVIGGHMQGVYTLYAQSREQSLKVATALDLLLTTTSVSLGPGFSQQLSTIAKDYKVNMACKVSIAGLAQPPKITEANMADFASGFGTIELDKPEVLSLQTLGYEAVEALREAFQTVAKNRVLLCGQGATPGVLDKRRQLREIANQCDWVKGTYATYGLTPDPTLAPLREKVRTDIRTIDALCIQYHNTPSTALTKPTLESLATGSPRLQVKLSDGATMGGGGGEPFGYQDRDNAVRRRRRLAQVGLNARDRIDQIRLLYQQEPIGGADEWIRETHGGSGGKNLGELELGTGVSIARIEALTGIPNGRVDQLKLTSSDGQTIDGGGKAGNTPLDWQPAANQVLLGFSGRCKAELDSLRAVIATFGPLAWEPLFGENEA